MKKMKFTMVRFTYDNLEIEDPFFEKIIIWSKTDIDRDLLLSLYGHQRPLGGLLIPYEKIVVEYEDVKFTEQEKDLN